MPYTARNYNLRVLFDIDPLTYLLPNAYKSRVVSIDLRFMSGGRLFSTRRQKRYAQLTQAVQVRPGAGSK